MLHRILISGSDEQVQALDVLMKEDTATNKSAYLFGLVGAEKRRRELEREKRAVGRPRKGDEPIEPAEDAPDYTDDVPKNIPHFGRMVGQKEYADIKSISEAFKQGL